MKLRNSAATDEVPLHRVRRVERETGDGRCARVAASAPTGKVVCNAG